jgi:hypothetical protein
VVHAKPLSLIGLDADAFEKGITEGAVRFGSPVEIGDPLLPGGGQQPARVVSTTSDIVAATKVLFLPFSAF